MTIVADPVVPRVPFADLAARAELAAGPEWLVELRRDGFDRFADVGIPTSKDEEWRVTPVGAIGTREWRAADADSSVRPEDIAPYTFGQSAWPLLVV